MRIGEDRPEIWGLASLGILQPVPDRVNRSHERLQDKAELHWPTDPVGQVVRHTHPNVIHIERRALGAIRRPFRGEGEARQDFSVLTHAATRRGAGLFQTRDDLPDLSLAGDPAKIMGDARLLQRLIRNKRSKPVSGDAAGDRTVLT